MIRNLFSRYGLLNLYLLLGALTSIIDHKMIWSFLPIGILLPFLDSLDSPISSFFKIEVAGKIVWSFIMIILIVEAGIYFL